MECNLQVRDASVYRSADTVSAVDDNGARENELKIFCMQKNGTPSGNVIVLVLQMSVTYRQNTLHLYIKK